MHKNNIIHRDIKPANILVDDVTRRPKLADFGLAKVLRPDEEPADAALETRDGILGTVAFMAPEQARSERASIGPHSDQYSLGGVLYQCLTGSPPFEGSTYAMLADVAGETLPTPVRQICPAVSKDLAAICDKAMSKKISDRYGGLTEMAEDLSRWLLHQPVRARPVSVFVRFARWCRRNQTVASLAGSLVFVLLSGTGILMMMLADSQSARIGEQEARQLAEQRAREADLAREDAERNAEEAVAAQKTAENALKTAHEAKLKAEEKEAIAVAAQTKLKATVDQLTKETQRGDSAEMARDAAKSNEAVAKVISELEKARNFYTKAIQAEATEPVLALLTMVSALKQVESIPEVSSDVDSDVSNLEKMIRQFIGARLPQVPELTAARPASPASVNLPPGSPAMTSQLDAHTAVFSRDGSRIAALVFGRLQVMDTATGNTVYSDPRSFRSPFSTTSSADVEVGNEKHLSFGLTNDMVCVAGGGQVTIQMNVPNQPSQLVTVDAFVEVHSFANPKRPEIAARSANGQTTVNGKTYQTGPVWRFPVITNAGVVCIGLEKNQFGFLQQRAFLYSHSGDARNLAAIDTADEVVGFSVTPTADMIVATGSTVRIYPPKGLPEPLEFIDTVSRIVSSKDGSCLAVVLNNGEVHVCSRRESDPRVLSVRTSRQQKIQVVDAAFAGTSETLLTASSDQHLRAWNVTDRQLRAIPTYCPRIPVLVSGDQATVRTLCADGSYFEWRLPVVEPTVVLGEVEPAAGDIRPDGQGAVLVTDKNVLSVFDTQSGALTGRFTDIEETEPGARIRDIEFTDGGNTIAVCAGRSILFFDATTARPVRNPISLAVAEDADIFIQEFAVADAVDSGQPAVVMLYSDNRAYSVHPNRRSRLNVSNVSCVAVSSNGQEIAIGTSDGRLVTLSYQDGRILQEADVFKSAVTVLRYSADGQRIVVGSSSGHVTIIDKTTLKQLVSVQRSLSEQIESVRFLEDSSLVGIVSDREICLWDTAKELITAQHPRITACASVAPNGKYILEGRQFMLAENAVKGSAAEVAQMVLSRTGLTLKDGSLEFTTGSAAPQKQNKN
ncbi:MAG: protein kinase [Planctomycetaceae bacterium]|nr:protein kinase [Planctomycetaceae bacterium]